MLTDTPGYGLTGMTQKQKKLPAVIAGAQPDDMDLQSIELYADGALYDAEYGQICNDIPFYTNIAATAKGPVLELACGTGRLTIPMAKAGATIVGIDIAPGMIAEAETKKRRCNPPVRNRLEFFIGDMRSVRLVSTFDIVILPFNALMHMALDEDLQAVLETVRKHLIPDGLFYLDVHTPYPTPAATTQEKDDERHNPRELVHPRTGTRFCVSEKSSYDARSQINTMSFFYQQVDKTGRPVGSEVRRNIQLRAIFPRELDLWLSICGFEIVSDCEDFDTTKSFTGKGSRRVIAARSRY